MKNFAQRINKAKTAVGCEKFLAKCIIVLLALCISFLLVINQYAISFSINGFGKFVKNPLQVYFLDVGQASATLVILPNDQTMLIDTGTQESAHALTESLNWIFSKNKIDCIDFLVLTHSDADHVGGTEAVMKNFDVAVAFRPKLLSREEMDLLLENDFQIVYTDAYSNAMKALNFQPNCHVEFVEDLQMQMETLSIKFYATEDTSCTETNAYSPFITLEYCGKTFMFTGDATAQREAEFLQELQENDISIAVDFLQVAHHGSRYSSTQNFLEATQPKFAFFSAGDSTHPTQQVIRRLKDVGTQDMFVTKDVGTIGVAVDEKGNFFICTSAVYADIPCFVVIFCLAGLVGMFFVDKSGFCSKGKVFFSKSGNLNKKFV